MKWIIPFVFAAFIGPAHGRTALDYYNHGDFEKSRNLLLRQVKSNPSNALDWFNLGNSYFMLKQFKYAEISFYKVETLQSPLAPAAILYRAKAMTARGEAEGAGKLLQSLLLAPNLPRAIHGEATKDLLALQQPVDEDSSPATEALHLYQAGKYRKALRILSYAEPDENSKLLRALILVKLDREDAAEQILTSLKKSPQQSIQHLAHSLSDRIRNTYSKPKWLFVESAAGHDSNVYKAASADAGQVWFTNAGGGGRFWSESLWYATGGYIGRWREYFSHSDLRVLSHEARANFGREAGTELLLLSPFALHESWGGKPGLFSKGLTTRLRTGSEGLEFGLEAEWTSDSVLDNSRDYLAGTSQHYQVFAGIVTAPVYARAYVSLDRRDIGDQHFTNGDVIPEAYRALGPGITVLWRPRADWIGELSGSYVQRSYLTHAMPGNESREDNQLSLSLRATKVFSPALSAYAASSQTKNSSTLDASSVTNENYSELQFLLGVVWDAL